MTFSHMVILNFLPFLQNLDSACLIIDLVWLAMERINGTPFKNDVVIYIALFSSLFGPRQCQCHGLEMSRMAQLSSYSKLGFI